MDDQASFEGSSIAPLLRCADREAAASLDSTLPIPDEAHPGPVWIRVEPGSASGHARRASCTATPLRPGGSMVLGSGSEADVRIADSTVSARHCRVEHVGTALMVTDLGSRNGVRVGGARISTASVLVGTALELGRSLVRLEPAAALIPVDEPPLPQLVGASPAMRRLAKAVRRVAPLRLPVLLRGESGSGKELVARAIHQESARAEQRMISLNAATISRELAESELFGHKKGAFTGASRDRRGAFREASGGTLFLDEIASLPLEVQAKLLRAVEEGVVRPLGAESGSAVDVRLVAATCEPLEGMVRARAFRADLYERLAVCVIQVPPLRDRTEDMADLVAHLLATSEVGERRVAPGALTLLRAQRWPGNVRELRNVVVQAALRARGTITTEDVAAVLAERASAARPRVSPVEALRLLEEAGGNMSAAARRGDIPRSTLRDLVRAARTTRWPLEEESA